MGILLEKDTPCNHWTPVQDRDHLRGGQPLYLVTVEVINILLKSVFLTLVVCTVHVPY